MLPEIYMSRPHLEKPYEPQQVIEWIKWLKAIDRLLKIDITHSA
jgi:hypothetical protein